ncbi:MAG: 6-bladed beta-propeller [Prevotellaceae bacterium]|jgi:hypothetical protein|nr:6-bladed beta-propeller [Prevotellaceae bacterium]
MKKILLIFIVLSFTSGNNYKIAQNVYNQTVISVNPDNALKEIKASSIYSEIKYIPLETPDDHLIGMISQILFYKDRFYILDEEYVKSIFCFDKSGKFLFEINRVGHGPGEYLSPESISINYDTDQLLLFCGTTLQIFTFDLDGNYIKSQKAGYYASYFAYIKDGYSAFSVGYNDSNADTKENNTFPNLLIVDSDYKINSVGLPVPDQVNFSAITQLACCFSPDVEDGAVSMINSCNDTVYHVFKDKVKRAYYIDFGKRKMTKGVYDLMRDKHTAVGGVRQYMSDNNICSIFHLAESRKNISFVYTHSNKVHFAFYNKATAKLTDVVMTHDGDVPVYPIINDIDGCPISIPYYSDAKNFYGFISPEEFMTKKEAILNSQSPDKEHLISILDKAVFDDNPIITIMNFK